GSCRGKERADMRTLKEPCLPKVPETFPGSPLDRLEPPEEPCPKAEVHRVAGAAQNPNLGCNQSRPRGSQIGKPGISSECTKLPVRFLDCPSLAVEIKFLDQKAPAGTPPKPEAQPTALVICPAERAAVAALGESE